MDIGTEFRGFIEIDLVIRLRAVMTIDYNDLLVSLFWFDMHSCAFGVWVAMRAVGGQRVGNVSIYLSGLNVRDHQMISSHISLHIVRCL